MQRLPVASRPALDRVPAGTQAPRRGIWATVLSAAAVLAAVALAALGPVAPARAAGLLPPANPPRNFPDPLSGSILCSYDGHTITGPCDLVRGQLEPDAARIRSLYLAAINAARASEGLGPLTLPANYASLSLPQRLMFLLNAERTSRGLPPVVGRLAQLDQVAVAGARANADPQFPSGWQSAGGSVWGDGYGATSIWFDWMYYDGWGGSQAGTPNLDCSSPAAPGCWGHRDILLDDWGPSPIAGIATSEEPNGQQVSAAIILSSMPRGGIAALPGPLIQPTVAVTASPPATVEVAGLPAVTGIAPAGGPPAGGTQVTVTGTGFLGATAVDFGGVPSPSASIVSDTKIVAQSPPGTGSVDVTVVTAAGTSPPLPTDVYTYGSLAAPDTVPPGGGAATGPGATGAGTAASRFDDLAGYGWAQPAIDDLAARGIVQGVAPGKFDPGGTLSRAQLAVLLTRLFNLPAPAQPVAFADVAAGSWDYGGIEAASPYIGYPSPASPSAGPHFAPGGPAERQTAAAAVIRLLLARGALQPAGPAGVAAALAAVPDAGTIDPALRTDVALALSAGLMDGFPGGDFRPTEPLNRAQAAVLLDRLLVYLPG